MPSSVPTTQSCTAWHVVVRRHEAFTRRNTTELTHEFCLHLFRAGGVRDQDEPAFLAYASEVMCRVVIDAARARSCASSVLSSRPLCCSPTMMRLCRDWIVVAR